MDDVRDRVGGQTWKNNSGEDFREARPARAFVPPPAAGAADLEHVGVLSVGRNRGAGAEEDWEHPRPGARGPRVDLSGSLGILSKSGSNASARIWPIDDSLATRGDRER